MSQADWDRLQYYSRKVKFFEFTAEDYPRIHPSTYFRIGQRSTALFPSLRHLHYSLDQMSDSHIFLHLSPFLDSLTLDNIEGFENTVVGPFLATLSSSTQMLRRIVLKAGQISVDVLKKSFIHFKQLRSLELSDAVFMSDFSLLEVLGTLPSLENLTLEADDPESYLAHAPENFNSQSGGLSYFEALESLCVTGSFILIRHLLGFIDSSCLKSIEIYPVINQDRSELEPDSLFTPSMTIVVSKWSKSLKNLAICQSGTIDTNRYVFSKLLIFLKDLHSMETFRLDWRMKNWEDLKGLVTSWPKLRTLNLIQTLASLSILGLIAENCPQLRHLHIRLNTSIIRPFDISSKNLRHNLENLTVGKAHASSISAQKTLECQIKVTRHLNTIFPFLKFIEVQRNDVFWSGIRDLVHLCQESRTPA